MGKKSEKVKKDLAAVQVFSRVGRIPLVTEWDEYIGPGIPPKRHQGVALEFGPDGVCDLDPVRDAEKIRLFREWLEDGTDPRIVECGVVEIATSVVPPFPKWDVTTAGKLPEMVEALGLDPEHCLKYELTRADGPRKAVVKALEDLVDQPVSEEAQDEPVL